MAKDFRAGQIRTTQLIASGSTLNMPSLLVASASSPGVDFDGSGIDNAVLLANVGQDVFVFVSGTSGSQGTQTPGVTLFGGDIFVSGNIFTPEGVITASAGGGGSGTPGGSPNQVQFNDGGSFGGDSGLTYDGATLTVGGDLTVNGTTTTVNSDNLVVKDPLIYIASGNAFSNQEGGIAIASGSATADQALVFGRVANDTWGAGKLDVEAGGIANGDISAMTVVPIRASRFEVGQTGGSTYMTQSATGHLELVASYIELGILNGASTIAHTASDVRFGGLTGEYGWEIPPQPGDDSFFFVSGNIGGKDAGTRAVAVFGGDVVTSGNMHALNGITGSLTKLTDGSSFLVAGSGMTITTGTSGNVTLAAGGGGGGSTFWGSTSDSEAFTTGSISISGGSGVEAASTAGTDIMLWVSGATESSKDGALPGVAAFGGHVVVSGSIYGGASPFFPTPTTMLDLRSDIIVLHSDAIAGIGEDVAVQIAGMTGSRGTSIRGVAEFTGDVHISGTRTGGSSYGGMYAYTTGTEQVLVANTPEIVDWNALNSTAMSGTASVFANPTTGQILMQPGPWDVHFNAAFSGTAESIVKLECRFDGEIQNQIAAQRGLDQVGSIGNLAAAGIIIVPPGGSTLELWVESTHTAVRFTRLSLFAKSL